MGEYGERERMRDAKGITAEKWKTEQEQDPFVHQPILKQQGLHHKKLIADRANIHPRIQSSASQRIIPMFPHKFTGCLKLFCCAFQRSGM